MLWASWATEANLLMLRRPVKSETKYILKTMSSVLIRHQKHVDLPTSPIQY